MGKKNKVHFAFVAHGGLDAIGWWGWWGYGGYAAFLNEINMAYRKAKLFDNFTYHFEVDGYTYLELKKIDNEEIRVSFSKLRELVKQDRVELTGGTFAGPFAPFTDSESCIRHFEYGLDAIKNALGIEVKTYYAQEPNFSLQSPFILKEFGFENVVFRYEYNGFIPRYNYEKISWKGLDGTVIDVVPIYDFPDGTFCNMEGGFKGTNILMDYLNNGTFGRLGNAKDYLTFAEKKRVSNPLILFCRDVGVTLGHYFSNKHIKRVSKDPLVKFVTLAEHCKQAKSGPEAALKADDLLTVSRYGWLGDEIRKRNRNLTRKLYSTEVLNLIAAKLGFKDRTDAIKEVWYDSLVCDNHDLLFFNNGLGTKTLTLTVNEAIKMASRAKRNIAQLQKDIIEDIAGEINTENDKRNCKENNTIPLIIFNTLPWQRKKFVSAEVMLPRGTKGVSLVDSNGNELVSQISEMKLYSDKTIRKAKIEWYLDFEGIGYQTVYVTTKKRRFVQQRFDSNFYSVEIDNEKGYLSTITDKETGIVYPGPHNQFTTYLGELDCWARIRNIKIEELNGGPCGKTIRISGVLYGKGGEADPGSSQEVFEKFPAECPPKVKMEIKIPFTTDITLYSEIKRIDFLTTFDFPLGTELGKRHNFVGLLDIDKQMAANKYALRVNFTCKGKRKVMADIPFGVDKRDIKAFPGLMWCGVETKDGAFSLINQGTLGYYQDKNTIGNILASVYKGVEGLPQGEAVSIYGRYSYRYSFTSSKYLDIFRITQQAYNVNTPLIVAGGMKNSGNLPSQLNVLNIKGNVVSTSIRNKKGIELRLYECSGKKTLADIKVNKVCSIKNAELVTLKGENRRQLNLRKGKMSIEFKPWEVKTVRMW